MQVFFEGEEVDISKVLNEVALDIRHDFVEWIDKIGEGQKDIEWWFDALSTRNNYLSNVFLELCYLEVLKKVDADYVVVDSEGLKKAIEKNFGIRVEKVGVSTNWLFYARWGLEIARMIDRWVRAKVTGIGSEYEKVDVVISTFVHKGDIDRDRYFPFLHEYFEKKKLKVATYPMLVGRHSYHKLRDSEMDYIIPEDFLGLKDLVNIALFPLSVLRRKVQAGLFRGMDVGDIVEGDKKRQPISVGMQAYGAYKAFSKVCRVVKPEEVLIWHENQGINKAMVTGAREAGVEKVMGHQGFIHSPLMTDLFISTGEVARWVAPDLVLTTGKVQCKIAKTFGDFKCLDAGALRYKHLFDKFDAKDPFVVLVLLPFDIGESIELLDKIRGMNDIVLVKAHPDVDTRVLGKMPRNFTITLDSMNMDDCLRVAKCVISANTSAVLESVVRGVPVVVVLRKGMLNFNRLSDCEMVTECYEKEEIRKAVSRYCSISKDEKDRFNQIGNEIRNLYFNDVNDKELEKFLW